MTTTPKKSLGQHWLKDQKTLEAVCEAGLVHEHDVVVEIGPGLGTLTEVLLMKFKAGQVIAIEKDERLAAELKERLKTPRLVVYGGDILEFDLTKLPKGYKVVANIPYYLTSNLIRILSESKNPPKIIALLVQKEVAERIAARPGDMSLLSVGAQIYYDCKLGPVVPAEKFDPPPKVDSQIVQMVRKFDETYQHIDITLLFQVTKAGFSSRRKTLENSLAGGLQMGKGSIREVLAGAGIDPAARPQELSLDQWIKLADILKK